MAPINQSESTQPTAVATDAAEPTVKVVDAAFKENSHEAATTAAKGGETESQDNKEKASIKNYFVGTPPFCFSNEINSLLSVYFHMEQRWIGR